MSTGRGGDGGRDWSNIDWSNVDFRTFGRRRRPGGRGVTGAITAVTILVLLLVLLPIIAGPLVAFLTDLLWFRSVGFEDVYLLRYTAAFSAFVVFFFAFFLFAALNLYFALRPQLRRTVVEEGRPRGSALRLTLRLLPFLLIPAFVFGLIGSGEWDALLRWRNAVPFGSADPLFGRDIGFYFFTLPVLEFLRGWVLGALVVVAIGVVALYAARGFIGAIGDLAGLDLRSGNIRVDARSLLPFARPARAHLSVLAGLFLALVAAGYYLDQFDLLFREEAVLTGAGYTSANARLPGLTILVVIVGIAALAAFANAVARTVWLVAGAIGLWLVASVLVLGVYPAIVQALVVRPDELNRERQYLERHIAATRAAYGLANAEESLFDVADNPGPDELRAFLTDVSAVRLWDYRPLLDAYQQLQALRQYYAFFDVDVDRYTVGGKERPVMLAARELETDRLPREARTWQNEHLVFTHGFGAVMTSVGAVTPEGLPRLNLRDIPPQGEPKVDQPRIYYGELTADYAIVGTTQDEFDFPSPEGRDATTRFSGSGGVSVGSLWDRILFALRFGDGNLLVTPQLRSESRVLFHRVISERNRLIAPFLQYDLDPYLVIADGQLYWIHDAYTVGERYPYSRVLGTIRRGGERVVRSGLNYVRNSVKVVTNAYDGSVTFYVVDETDPVIRNLRAIYPSLFSKTIADMPAALRAHVRYPEDLFRIQVEIFSTFHMLDPDEFYNRGDAWKIANEIFEQGGTRRPIEPYYVTMQLPGSTRSEFVLFVPMTPAGADRDNMVAWMAGRADPPDYGKIRVLRFAKDRVIFGPLQIEARIEADSSIRQQLTLLSSGAGATVIRGNLLVLPVGDSFLYVEPLFVQATQGRIPELRRVILATQDRVVMEDTFERALARLVSESAAGAPPTTAPPTRTPPPPGLATPTPPPGQRTPPRATAPVSPPTAEIAALIREASQQFERAQAALRAGDFAEYGRQIKLLEETLAKLRAATGQ